jgi:hypothetical protein
VRFSDLLFSEAASLSFGSFCDNSVDGVFSQSQGVSIFAVSFAVIFNSPKPELRKPPGHLIAHHERLETRLKVPPQGAPACPGNAESITWLDYEELVNL